MNNDYPKLNSLDPVWLDKEIATCKFKDKRIGKRFKILCQKLADNIGAPIPFACQDWANTKAAYRFLSNNSITEEQILKGHFEATKLRVTATDEPILILQDTTEISYQSSNPENIGKIKVLPKGRDVFGKARKFTQCGILMHPSLAITTSGLPLGMVAIKCWTRNKFKGRNSLENKINNTRVPIELKESIRWINSLKESTKLLAAPDKCIHIGDRESDIYELFHAAKEANTHFLVRTHVDRLAGDGTYTIANVMAETKVKGVHKITIRDKNSNIFDVTIDIKYRKVKVLPSISKQKKYQLLNLTIIYAKERGQPKNRPKIVWKLITDLVVSSNKDVLEKINWYAMRWKIESFFKILKSGCKVEDLKLRSAERLIKLISIYCIFSWRIFWMTMINRDSMKMSPKTALTELEIQILNKLAKKRGDYKSKYLADYLMQIAKLGGYLVGSSNGAVAKSR